MLEPVTLIAVDLYQLREINKTKGFEYGDSLLRWLGIAIKDETESTVYRISGDNFVAVLIGSKHKKHAATTQRLFDRLNSETEQLGLKPPVARMAVIHFPDSRPLNPPVVWKNLNEKMAGTTADDPFKIFQADTSEEDQATLRAIELMANRTLTINRVQHDGNLLLDAGKVVPGWAPGGFESLSKEDFAAIVALRPEQVLIGTGARLRFPSPGLMRPLIDARIGYEVMDLAAACRTYNVLVSEGRAVAAALMFD